MIICETCKKKFLITSDSGENIKSISHLEDGTHRFPYKDRIYHLENFIRLVYEEEISVKDSGENQVYENPDYVPCFLCGKNQDPCICPMCNVVVCKSCWNDHDKLLSDIDIDLSKNS